nr:hypothetical protein [Candidatus Sigynarchaeota archaeon]
KDKVHELVPDALDMIRQAIPENPRLLNESQVHLLADFLNDEDDMFRASAVLALKPAIPEKSIELFKILAGFIDSPQKTKNCKEEAIRLLGHMATIEPGRVSSLIPRFISFLMDDDVHVRKRSLEVLKVLSKHDPKQIENGVKWILDKITDEELVTGVNELVTSIIKRRELREIEVKPAKDEKPTELIPEVKPESMKESAEPPVIEAPAPPEVPSAEKKNEAEIRKEIDAKIQEEFSKIEEGKKTVEIPLKDMKEIKSDKDLEHRGVPETIVQKIAVVPGVVDHGVQVQPKPTESVSKEASVVVLSQAPIPVTPLAEESEKHADMVKKQLEVKEKMLQKREEELKRLQIERKELELAAQELEMQRDELIKVKLEQLEMEVKRKEQEVKAKELSLKLKELESREQKLKETEESLSKKS